MEYYWIKKIDMGVKQCERQKIIQKFQEEDIKIDGVNPDILNIILSYIPV